MKLRKMYEYSSTSNTWEGMLSGEEFDTASKFGLVKYVVWWGGGKTCKLCVFVASDVVNGGYTKTLQETVRVPMSVGLRLKSPEMCKEALVCY